VLVGSPAYMSPEQARGEVVGPAADVFSWASTVAFGALGRPPFSEGEATAILYRVVHDEPDLEGLDPAVAPFVMAALDKDPANRPTPVELQSGLAGLLVGQPSPVLGHPVPLGPIPGMPTALLGDATLAGQEVAAEQTMVAARALRASLPPRRAERAREERRRRNAFVFWAGMLALVACVAAAIVVVRARSDTPVESLAGQKGVIPEGGTTSTVPATPGGPVPPGPAPSTTVVPSAGGAPGAVTPPAPPTQPTVPAPATSVTQQPASTTTTLRATTCEVRIDRGQTVAFGQVYRVIVTTRPAGAAWTGIATWSAKPEDPRRLFDSTTGSEHAWKLVKVQNETTPPLATPPPEHPEHPNTTVPIEIRLSAAGPVSCGVMFVTQGPP